MENNTNHNPAERPMSPDRVRFAMARAAAQAANEGRRDEAVEIARDVTFYEDRLSEILGHEVDRLLR